MNLEIEILEECTLLQACEWIAFDWKPMSEMYENAIGRVRPMFDVILKREYDQSIERAKNLLLVALYQGKIIPKYNDFMWSSIENKILNNDDMQIILNGNDLCTSNSLFFPERRKGKASDICIPVKINFEELQKFFPSKKKIVPNESLSYTTPYLEIMNEIIAEFKITQDNQLLKKQLIDPIKEKMVNKNLPKSDNLANVMATLIRLPDMQNGRAKKG
ncbi:MAG: hypothetical protein LBU68_00700 [Rickettsiales bacterium]|jgi:hypothetical protein|nr:hypothetical protein [Rickettsiales bacterium]